MKIDHICFAVKDIQEGISYWGNTFGYRQMSKIVENTIQKVKVTFLSKDDSILVNRLKETCH
jgi:catechol 2,3-dioxygenase-like lactoylglutathione lyase family enzyme